MARNPQCRRLTALTVAGVSPAEVSSQVYSHPVDEGLSPFAIRRGERFEEALFADQGKRLFTVYQQAGRLRPEETGFLDLSKQFPQPDEQGLQGRLDASLDLINRRLTGETGLPNLLVKPRFYISLMGQSFTCEPDALVAAHGDKYWRVVEIKSYADRWSFTDTVKTGSACRQAAVGFLALQQLVDQPMPPMADLVFARPGTNWPTLNPMNIGAEVSSLERALEEALVVAEVSLDASDGLGLDSKAGLEAIDNNPCSGCSDHCALWEVCFDQVLESQSPSVLGDSARETLVGVSSLEEAIELRERGSDPNPDRDLLARLLRRAQLDYQAGLGEL